MKRVLAFAPIPAVFLAGGGAARLLVRAAPARIAPDRAQPLLVVTAWGPFGSLAFAVLAATIALAAIALVVAIVRVGPPGAGSRAFARSRSQRARSGRSSSRATSTPTPLTGISRHAA
jgi:hypothetical protein